METPFKKDKEETKRRLIQATGEIFMSKGYTGLSAPRIANLAGVSKTLVYRYFGNVQELFKAYLLQKDYWITSLVDVEKMIETGKDDSGQELIKHILENHMNYFYGDKEMQQMIRWQLNEANDISRSIADSRERAGEDILEMTDKHFAGSGINFRALSAVFVSGIYLMVLNAKVTGSSFCGIDINREADMQEVIRTIKQAVDWAYERGGS
ncbi:TetR/AcrR family transcriptional regulator [Dyadobacter sp. CY312]|uniref:TetR/AcrR family transcriptional regulator n=1 Tax=Dyadobacter sp. CY312 TaxID=2907303 RepID=UPI001F344211|nr:TetR/AcrR family transcriptional regulator [Dyadobacter sp. CY312]MCE7042809.1 TetR/AcrR family transcriptional regulator [Dyadobacter sp. CY312]